MDEIARLKARISELETQAAIVGHKNPAWEAGYQRALYVMPDEIARAWCGIPKENPSYDDLKSLCDLVGRVMRGLIKNPKQG